MKTVDMKIHHLNVIHMYNFGMGSVGVAEKFTCNIYQIIGCVIGSGGGPYLFGYLKDL